MLYLFRPRFGAGGTPPTPAQILGPWLERRFIERKRREREEREKEDQQEKIEAAKQAEVIEKAEDLAVDILRVPDSAPKVSAYTKELEESLLKLAQLSAKFEEIQNKLQAAALEAQIKRQLLAEELKLQAARQVIALKILEMQEEEEALLLLMMMDN